MESNIAIDIQNVSMLYNISTEKVDSLKEYFVRMLKGQLFYEEFKALEDISFSIKKGEVFGLIGLNGAGKSTLLKIIAGVLKPTTGKVKINGAIAPLIELGAGFNFDLTGRENVFLNGAVLGYSRPYMKEMFDEVAAFSELGKFIDVPIKNYSSGMIARLAFSIATAIKPDILIVDEVLSVGDYKFQEKSKKRIEELFTDGTTVVIVSHSKEQIEELCNRVIWLEEGKMKEIGNTSEIMRKYKES
ncbi:ABC transporter ATP-binding protein [Paenibacillus qinlingensis]|uniref:ABC transporter ATP-binding protein n=1 Tax=Paenibacillus qinlingensis TaxID=1837343 RepID=UPI001566C983|nr:ABC transporter ATP-binding protein [Paenibacillus qinlingensis]NQX60238.1 ABC transporter ATP-binding protein [Paenibacillus qinlingensis]